MPTIYSNRFWPARSGEPTTFPPSLVCAGCFVTYIFCCIFPFDCCAKTEEEEEKGGERNFSGVAVWWCCGFLSHTCQVHPTPRYTTQAGERERERKEEEKIRVETTPFSQILFQRIFIFHFLTTVTHTQTSNPRNDRPTRQLRNSK